MVKRFVLLAFAAVSLAAVFSAPASANETPQPTSAVAFDGDFAYWAEIGPEPAPVATSNAGGGDETAKPRAIIATIVQLTISTGVKRTIFSTRSDWKTYLQNVQARAGRIAFTSETYSRSKKTPHLKRIITKAYAMGASDTVAAALEEQTMTYRGVNKTIKKKGKKYKEFVVKSYCGGEIDTRDVSELGVVLVTRSTVGCKKRRVKSKSKKRAAVSQGGGSYKYLAFAYAPGATTPTALGKAPGGDVRLRYNELFGYGEGETLAAHDTSTNAIRSYPDIGWPVDIEIDADRRVAVVSSKSVSKHVQTQSLAIFPPAATEPSVRIPIADKTASDVSFCGDYLLQVSGQNYKYGYYGDRPGKGGTLTLTLRDFTGAVVGETVVPNPTEYFGSSCVDRVARVATSSEAGLAISSYAL